MQWKRRNGSHVTRNEKVKATETFAHHHACPHVTGRGANSQSMTDTARRIRYNGLLRARATNCREQFTCDTCTMRHGICDTVLPCTKYTTATCWHMKMLYGRGSALHVDTTRKVSKITKQTPVNTQKITLHPHATRDDGLSLNATNYMRKASNLTRVHRPPTTTRTERPAAT